MLHIDLTNDETTPYKILSGIEYQFKVPIPNKQPRTVYGKFHNEFWEDSLFSVSIDRETYNYFSYIGLARNFIKNAKIKENEYREKALKIQNNFKAKKFFDEQVYEGYSHVFGILAEYAYSCWSGKPLDLNFYANGGDQGDFANGLVEIKGVAWCGDLDPTLKFRIDKDWVKSQKNGSIAYVLVRIKDGFAIGKDYCLIEIVGWISSAKFNQYKEKTNRIGHWNWEVHSKDLYHYLPEGKQEELIQIALSDKLELVLA